MIVDDNFNSGCVHRQGFTERAGFAHEDRTALTQGAIDGFHDAGLTLCFGARAVRASGQGFRVGRKQVGEVPAVPPVAAR